MTTTDYWLKRQTKAELIKRIRAAECVQDNVRLDADRREQDLRLEIQRLSRELADFREVTADQRRKLNEATDRADVCWRLLRRLA